MPYSLDLGANMEYVSDNISPVANEGILTHLPLVIALPLETGEEVSGLDVIVNKPRLSKQK